MADHKHKGGRPKGKVSMKRRAELRERRKAAHQPVPKYDNPHQVLSIEQWCALNGYSVVAGRKKLRAGQGPLLLKLSARRYGIRVSDDIAWKDDLAKQS